jgi:hypothetical protein
LFVPTEPTRVTRPQIANGAEIKSKILTAINILFTQKAKAIIISQVTVY